MWVQRPSCLMPAMLTAPPRPTVSPPHPVAPPFSPQMVAITPFQIVSALVFGLTVYGMSGLRHGAAAVLKNGLVNTLMYLIASQVGGAGV